MLQRGQALQLEQRFEHVTGIAGALARFVDELAVGVVVLDPDGRALHLNRCAEGLIARGDGLRLDRTGRPTTNAPDCAAARADLIARVRRAVPPGGGAPRGVPRRGGHSAYCVLVSPHPAEADAAPGSVPASVGALLLIHDPDALILPLPAMLRTLFGLTGREAELVAALVAGLRLAEIAAQSGTSLNTVKFHLKSVYLKTDTNTQSALIRKVAASLAGLGGEGFAPLWRQGDTAAARPRRSRNG